LTFNPRVKAAVFGADALFIDHQQGGIEDAIGGGLDGQWHKIARALDALESRWMDHLNGPLDMAQIALACALGYVDFRLDVRGWRDGHPHLAAWAMAFAARPSMIATRPPA
jgi:glutathione S-transferase